MHLTFVHLLSMHLCALSTSSFIIFWIIKLVISIFSLRICFWFVYRWFFFRCGKYLPYTLGIRHCCCVLCVCYTTAREWPQWTSPISDNLRAKKIHFDGEIDRLNFRKYMIHFYYKTKFRFKSTWRISIAIITVTTTFRNLFH